MPPEVRERLAAEGPVAAGEQLVRHAEEMVRSRPGAAREWGESLAGSSFDDDVLTGCARWAAGVALYLAGDAGGAEPVLIDGIGRLRRADEAALADRASLVLVDLHAERSRIDRARRLARRLHRRFRDRGDRQRAAVALANLGSVEDAVDRVARARALWRRARRDLEPGSLRRLLTEANLATVAALEGRLREAARGLQGVADEARSQRLEGLALQAELNLAEVEFAAGAVDDALSLWQRVIAEAKESGNAAVEVAAGIDLAGAEAGLGDLRGAATRLEAVLPTAKDLGLDGEFGRGTRLAATIAAVRRGPGAWKLVEGRLSASTRGVEKDLLLIEVAQLDPACEPRQLERAARRLMRSGHLQRGRLGLAWAARRHLDRGRVGRARGLAREVLAVRGLAPWTRMLAQHVLGRSGVPPAMRFLLAAARSADAVHGRLAAAADRQAFLAVRADIYLDLLEALLARNRAADRRRALAVAGRLRSGWLLDELARRADRGNDPEVRRWQELRCRLAALLHEMEGAGEPRVRRSGLRLQTAIAALELDIRRAQTGLARRWPLPGCSARDGSVDELLAVLPAGDLFVEYLVMRDDLVVFQACRGTISATVVRGGAPALNRLLASVQFHIESAVWSGGGAGGAQRAALDDRLRSLGAALLGPVSLDGVERLWIAPHGGLFHVPWPAIYDAGGSHLVERLPFTLVPGAEAAAWLLRERSRRPRSIAVGGAVQQGLPLVEKELREMGTLHAGLTIDEPVTRRGFLELLGEHEMVHLAGHALFLDGLPAASGLRMSDGYVTVHDLAATRLAARFVSFGVCSGLRLGRDTGDRYAGFVLALMSGGVRTVVGPAAPVRDEVAFVFDLALHAALRESDDPQAAFRAAVAAVRDSDDRPAVWGSFSYWGDPRSWEAA